MRQLFQDARGEVKTAVYLGSSVEYELEVESYTLLAMDTNPMDGGIFREGSPISVQIDPLRSYLLPVDKKP